MADVTEASPEESWAIFDLAARHELKVSGETFLARWDAGHYDHDDPFVAHVAMLIPFGRQRQMTTYTVTAKRWEHGWELHIDGVGVTQSRTLDSADRMVRDYIKSLTGRDAAADTVEIRAAIGPGEHGADGDS